MPLDQSIRVVLADDNLIVREGVRALLSISGDVDVVGVAGDYDELLAGAAEPLPQVVVTDIRMPPDFTDEGIRAARIVRKRHPGTGVVILSQYDEPEYAISLLSEGAAGYAYLLKDRVAEGDQLARAVREVSTGGSMLDPRIVDALTRPVSDAGGLTEDEERLLRMVAEGKPIKAIAASLHTTATSVGDDIEQLFLKLAQQMRENGVQPGRTERLTVTVLMSDIRAYSTIAEASDPSVLAGQLNAHRAAMNHAVLAQGGTVMQFVGDAVMAVFGAPLPQPDHAQRSLAAALAMHAAQDAVNQRWAAEGLPPFHLGIGLSTGDVAAALLGSDERLEYSVVGDAVNLAQRLQQWGEGGQTVVSEPTYDALDEKPDAERIPPALVKGRET